MRVRNEQFDRHHRKPRCQKKKGNHDTVVVPRTLHVHWHACFPGNLTPHQIADIINTTWLDPDYVFVVKRRHR